MKHYILFGLLLIHSFISAQLTDTTCIKSRWISLKPNEINKPLFSPLEDGTHLLFFLKGLLENGKLTGGICGYHYFNEIALSSVRYDHYSKEEVAGFDTVFSDNSSKQFYIVCPESTTPLSNMYGEDSVYQDGSDLIYVYPTKTCYHIDTEKFTEILIQEERIVNEKTKEYIFQPTLIGFVMKSYWGYGDLFWVDLEELCKQLESKGFYQWSKFIKENKYSGFQYAQKSCYDNN